MNIAQLEEDRQPKVTLLGILNALKVELKHESL